MKKFGVGVAALVMALVPTAANAHVMFAMQGNDYIKVSEDHVGGYVYDEECDGHSVYGQAKYGPYVVGLGNDTNGCNNSGDYFSADVSDGYVRVCERRPDEGTANDVCGKWVEVR